MGHGHMKRVEGASEEEKGVDAQNCPLPLFVSIPVHFINDILLFLLISTSSMSTPVPSKVVYTARRSQPTGHSRTWMMKRTQPST